MLLPSFLFSSVVGLLFLELLIFHLLLLFELLAFLILLLVQVCILLLMLLLELLIDGMSRRWTARAVYCDWLCPRTRWARNPTPRSAHESSRSS
jgi:hypothetical protein